MTDRPFLSDVSYSKEQILAKVPGAEDFEDESGYEYLIADTPETEYWLLREENGWYRLSHTWGHFLLVSKSKKIEEEKTNV